MDDLRLHLGCGNIRREGMINCDLFQTPATDVTFDVQRRWPFEDNTAAQIFSAHMLEHLTDHEAFFREAWRVLRPMGTLTLQLPYGASDEAMADLTHKRAWFPGSFCAFQPGYGAAIGNPQHQWEYPFVVNSIGTRIHKDLLWLARWPWRRLGLRLLRYVWGGFVELFVQMQPLKAPAQVALFHEQTRGNIVPVVVVAWEHEWNPTYTGPPQLREFASGHCVNIAPQEG